MKLPANIKEIAFKAFIMGISIQEEEIIKADIIKYISNGEPIKKRSGELKTRADRLEDAAVQYIIGQQLNELKICVELGLEVNSPLKGYENKTPAEYALAYGYLESFRTFLALGADPNTPGKPNRKSFFLCCVELPTAENLKALFEHGFIPDMQNPAHVNGIFSACLARSYECVEVLLDHGFPIEGNTAATSTPLMIAARNKDHRIMKLLISRGADVNAVKGGVNALMDACTSKDYQGVEMLLAAGASADATLPNFSSPLTIAMNGGQNKISLKLLECVSNVNVLDEEGHSPLMYACIEGLIEPMKVLIEKGADLRINSTQLSAIEICAEDNSVSMVEYLIKKCADRISDADFLNAIISAKKTQAHESAALIENHLLRKTANLEISGEPIVNKNQARARI